MSTKSVIKIGNKQLASPSLPIKDFATSDLLDLIQNMQDTMKEKVALASQPHKLDVTNE